MRTESMLFGGVAVFFGGSAALYGVWSGDETGTVALVVACGMAALVSFFCLIQYRRRGSRAQDRPEAEVADGAEPVAFFPDESMFPVITAFGFALAARRRGLRTVAVPHRSGGAGSRGVRDGVPVRAAVSGRRGAPGRKDATGAWSLS
ncbi:aa3-type cytochrome oxidase subunit IV [Streptomyces lasalocidi]